jgi:hypothetical protein
MQFFILILNIIFILHENWALVVKISKYEQKFWYFSAGFENIDFLGEETKFFQIRTYFFLWLMTIWTVYECCEKVLKQKTR